MTKEGTTHTMHTKEEKIAAFSRMIDVVDELRVKCPWDREQTNESLRENTIEETYELCDALLKEDDLNICKELGDVLLHVCFYSRIGSEKGKFDIADVCNALTDKLIYRHPHVYHPSQVGAAQPKPLPYVPDTDEGVVTPNASGASPAAGSVPASSAAGSVPTSSVAQVLVNWEQLKLKEKDGNKRILSGVPESLPSVIKAYRMQEKAANVGFDWEKREDVWQKVREELGELETEIGAGSPRSEEEFGDFLFSLINAARLYNIHPDNALDRTNAKFRRRFNYIEDHSIRSGKPLKDMTLAEMDALWNEAKQHENDGRQ